MLKGKQLLHVPEMIFALTMVEERYRINDNLVVEQGDGEYVLKFREEIGRGKRFGMDGTVPLDEADAETFAKWVFAKQFDESLP